MVNEYERLSRQFDIKTLSACETGYVDADDCSWYHQNWILLRQLGVVSNPFWHEHFFEEQLKEYVACRDSKMLVLGTADFSMPYLCRQVGLQELYISDICLTPLNICDMIAANEGYHWHTSVNDIREGLPARYDLIVNDAFLTRFEYEEKKDVLVKIGQALNAGGKYVTTIRKGWNNGKPVIPSKDEKDCFVKKAVKLSNGSSANDTEVSARQYIEKMISYPIKDEEVLFQLCKDLFSIEYVASIDVPGECVESTYLQAVLAKK